MEFEASSVDVDATDYTALEIVKDSFGILDGGDDTRLSRCITAVSRALQAQARPRG